MRPFRFVEAAAAGRQRLWRMQLPSILRAAQLLAGSAVRSALHNLIVTASLRRSHRCAVCVV